METFWIHNVTWKSEGLHTDSPLPAKQLRVAVAQTPVVADISVNIETIARAIDRAVAEKAEVLLTPEGSLSGYTHKFDQNRVEAGLKKLVAKASSVELALALGTCFVVLPHPE